MWYNSTHDVLDDLDSKVKKEAALEETNTLASMRHNVDSGFVDMELEDPAKSFRTAQDFEEHYRKKKVKADENSYLNQTSTSVNNPRLSSKINL